MLNIDQTCLIGIKLCHNVKKLDTALDIDIILYLTEYVLLIFRFAQPSLSVDNAMEHIQLMGIQTKAFQSLV